MAAASNFVASCGRQLRIGAAPVTGRDSCSSSADTPNPISRVGFSGRRQGRIQFDQLGKLGMNNNNSRKKISQYMHCLCTDDTVLVNQRVPRESSKSKHTTGLLAYELVQGNLVQWNSFMDNSVPDPPTCVLLHGILGSRKNWGSFSKRLAQEFPLWQFLLVDLRCHGDSASIKKSGPHTISSAALDVLKLVGQLRLTPRVLVGHSFGGKVALSMVEQAAKPLARPVRVWVLGATPGKVQAGGDGEDHPGSLISFLRNMPEQVSSKQEVVDSLVQQGFSLEVARVGGNKSEKECSTKFLLDF